MELGIGNANKIDHLEIPRGEIEEFVVKVLEKLKITDYRRQFKIGPYFADFYFPANNLVLEVDGQEHHTKEEDWKYDRQRDSYMVGKGYIVIRVTGSMAYKFSESILPMLRIFKKPAIYRVYSERCVKDLMIFALKDDLAEEEVDAMNKRLENRCIKLEIKYGTKR